MDINARPFRCFLAVAELSSFSLAATRLNVSQPALSATIKELERRLGFDLFDRSSRHVNLSVEGRQFLAYAQRYVRENNVLRQAWQEIRSNDLRISASFHTTLVPERNALIDRFLLANDACNLQVFNDEQERGFVRLDRGEVDLVIAIEAAQDTLAAEHSLHGVSQIPIERQCLATRKVSVMVPASHPLTDKPDFCDADLAGCEIVVPNRYYGAAFSEQIRFRLAELGAIPIRTPEGNSMGMELHAAARGLLAISLDWYRPEHVRETVVYRQTQTLGATQLSLVRPVGRARTYAEQLWGLASQCRGDPASL